MTLRKNLLAQTEMCKLWEIDSGEHKYELYSDYNSGLILFNKDDIEEIHKFLDYIDANTRFSGQGFSIASFNCKSNSIFKECTNEFRDLLNIYFDDISNLDLYKLSLERLISVYNKLKKDKSTNKVDEVA